MIRRWVVALVLLAAMLVALVPGHPAGATSPLYNVWFPTSAAVCGAEPGLDACNNAQYQIDGTGTFVQIFFRAVYDEDVPNDPMLTRMCGPTFGCQWVEHVMQPGEHLGLSIAEYQNMPVGTYTAGFCQYGYQCVQGSWSVS